MIQKYEGKVKEIASGILKYDPKTGEFKPTAKEAPAVEAKGIFPKTKVVVRSSALSEDGFSTANAGVYESVLNVDSNNIKDKRVIIFFIILNFIFNRYKTNLVPNYKKKISLYYYIVLSSVSYHDSINYINTYIYIVYGKSGSNWSDYS